MCRPEKCTSGMIMTAGVTMASHPASRSRNSRDEIADAHDVKPNRPRRASRYHDSLIKLLLGQDAVLRHERVVDHRQRGEPRKSGAGSLEQQQVEQGDIHDLGTGKNAPTKAAPSRT